ncbi:MAG: cadherin-like beta sandwich domain-containing protein, partial [Chitinophagaceae bacterium]
NSNTIAPVTLVSANANLSGLITTPTTTLTPTFTANTIAYTTTVANSTTTITVTPTREQANASIEVRVNGGAYAAVTSGSASGNLSLNVGTNTIDVRVTAQDGTTIKTYSLTVNRAAPSCIPTSSTFTILACGSYTWVANGSKVYTASNNIDTIKLVNAGGCDSIIRLNLTINVATTSTNSLTICSNQLPYTWNGLTFTAAGTQTRTGLVNSKGCDSSATLILTVNPTTSSNNALTICSNQLPFVWNGLTFTTAGTQTRTGLVNSRGCDSSATLTLTVNATTSSTNSLTICSNQLPYTWNGLTFTAAGTQTRTGLVNSRGCDSSATLTLTVNNTISSNNALTICPSQLPYVWNGLTFTAAGTQTRTGLVSSKGCDSSATLTLTVSATISSTNSLSICPNQLPFVWNGLTFTAGGTQTRTGLISSGGCDSSATLILTVNPNTSSINNLTICSNQLPYTWNGLTFTAAGTQTRTGLVNSKGCDSSATLILTVNPTT